LIQTGSIVVLPCSTLVKASLHTDQCKATKKTLRLDAQGRPMLPAVKAMDSLSGVVLQLGVETISGVERTVVRLQKLKGSLEVLHNGLPILEGRTIRLSEGDSLTVGSLYLRFRQPGSILAYSRVRGDRVVSQYPWGSMFSHVIAGVAGGPYRSTDDGLRSQIPFPARTNNAKKTPMVRMKTTMNTDIQQLSYSVGLRHFARLDSEEFKRRFRRRYINNPHKPHGGAIAIVNRRNGHLLSAISFPVFNPNRPKKNPADADKKARYLQGQIVDRFGITDSLLAYSPTRLPPLKPDAKRLSGRPAPIPDFLEALAWDKEEELRGVRGSARSGWLIERALGGVQTPGSTAKIVTAIAYARYLRKQGKAGQFPKHTCAGGLMFQLKTTKNKSGWRPSPIHFRCHKKSGHGALTLKKALGVSCNVYFAKLALEMAGVPEDKLRTNAVHWHRSRYGGRGRYQFLRIERNQISNSLRRDPSKRILFDTAHKLGFAMRYTYRIKRKPKAWANYTDVFWQPGQPAWAQQWKRKDGMTRKQRAWAHHRWLLERWKKELPFGYFGKGRFFGLASAYPAWQQWAHGQKDPRYGKPTSVVRTFGSTAASLRGMAYVGFGQNLSISPLRMALVSGTVANGGWMPAPRFWLPNQQGQIQISRPRNRRIFHANDAKKVLEAMAQVTRAGTGFKPFSSLNRKCLAQFGLRLVGKTGTAETRSAKSRTLLFNKVKSQRRYFRGGSYKRWIAETGCYRRRSWKFDYPEENVADSLFTGVIVPAQTPGTRRLPTGRGWRLQDLAFTMLVKNGYHPEGAPCVRGRRVLDRSEAKFLAHDVVVSLLHSLGVCKKYRAPSLPAQKLKINLRSRPRKSRRSRRKRSLRKSRRTRRQRTRRSRRTRRPRKRMLRTRKRSKRVRRRRSPKRRPPRRRPTLRLTPIQ
jgi:cell division protein FtsI/penicillin-binding protein 2